MIKPIVRVWKFINGISDSSCDSGFHHGGLGSFQKSRRKWTKRMVANNRLLLQMCRHPVGSMADLMLRNALLYPDRTAFVQEGRRLTYQQYNDQVNQLVHALRDKGLKKGDVVGVLSWN